MSKKQDRYGSREMQDSQEKLSGAVKIFESLSAVDEELLERSEGRAESNTQKKVIPFWRYSKATAACFCLAIAGAAVYVGMRFVSAPYGDKSVETQQAYDMADYDIAGQNQEGAENCAPEEQENGSAVKEAAKPESDAKEGMTEAASEKEGDAGNDIVQNAELSDQDRTDNADAFGGQKQADLENIAELEISVEKADYEPITEKEARETEKLGDYIPTELPAEYRFESAYPVEEDGVTKGVHLSWTRGMDYIDITVRDISTELDNGNRRYEYTIVDVSHPETYDEHMYEIPYAETVPEEYHEIFDHPIFREEDFTLDVVKARMKTIEDQGDTDTPRGMFGVLYEDGILVEFSGKGSVEEVWNLFQSIK